MIVDAVKDIGEVGLRIEAFIFAVSMIVMARASVSAPVSAPAKSQFFRPMPIGRRARSAGLLSMPTRPSSRNRQKDGQRLSP